MCLNAMARDWPEFHEHARFVRKIAWNLRRQRNIPRHVDIEDLLAEGMVGLVEARTRFDPNHGATFTTFAWRRVTGRILDYVRHECQVPTVDREAELEALPDHVPCNADSALELRRVLERAESLPSHLREAALVMLDRGGRSDDCAPVLGVNRRRYSYLRELVRQQLRAVVAG